jgi:hypothetical protein
MDRAIAERLVDPRPWPTVLSRVLRGLLVAAAVAGLEACAPVPGQPDASAEGTNDAGASADADAGATDAAAPDASVPDAGSGDAGLPDAGAFCSENGVPLLIVAYGDTERFFVAAQLEGRQVALQLDTGSGISFLFQGSAAPVFTPDAGFAQIGCETIGVGGRNLALPGQIVGGLAVVGLLGMDFLTERPSVLDVVGRTVTRYRDPPFGVALRTRFSFPFDQVQNLALVPCALDGVPVRLMFDTGGGHTLWVGVDGGPGDRVENVQDAQGNIFPISVGGGALSLLPDAGARRVPVARAPAFPYFAQTVAALGGNLHGLLGVTSFPNEALYVAGNERRIYVLTR